MRRGRVRPCIAEGAEARLPLGDRRKGVQQGTGRSGYQFIETLQVHK